MGLAARVAALLTFIAGCSDGTGVIGDTSRVDSVGVPDTEPAEAADETDGGDDVATADIGPETLGAFGASCTSNSGCESGLCVAAQNGEVCTRECTEECPEDYECRSAEEEVGGILFVCFPRVSRNCVPCTADSQCASGACLTLDGARQCAARCQRNEDCPAGYACIEDAFGDEPGLFCQPKSGSCECTPAFEGVRRTCTTANELGTCYGVETCDSDVGWVGCNAREPVAEACDYLDNDCDGDVDEDFKADGIYASVDGCGSCSTRCDDVLANATETECRVEGALARCRVISCEGGFNLVNPFVCAPDVGNFCQPCDDETLCIGTGAACTELGDGRYCTRGCVHDANCPFGFSCRETDNDMQCVPTSGSCTCDGSNLDLARACSRTLTPTHPDDPVVTCKGFEACTIDGWSGVCGLPADICDGIDNDCDGVIDGPYKTDGKYSALEHCGACEISCAVLLRPNSIPSCILGGDLPTCGIACVDGAFDVNGEGNDGCECIFQPGADLAGDDEDSNCDGVDGEVDNATFVSKEGRDDNPGTRELPVRTIQRGIELSVENRLRDVYVATGVYSENVLLADGVGVFGGYAPAFDDHEVALYETAIIGMDADDMHLGTVTAVALGAAGATADTVLDGFTVFGINAANTEGGTSYGIYVRNAGARLRISHNRVFGGPGGNGFNGVRGLNGLDGVDGAAGIQAKNLSATCQPAESVGGVGGVRICENLTEISGGNGGKAFCPHYEDPLPDGARGQPGKGTGGGPGGIQAWPLMVCANTDNEGCSTYNCGACRLPSGGKPYNARDGNPGGIGINGAGGPGGASNGVATTGLWVGYGGHAGLTGTNGGGGGGGGSAGGVEIVGTQCGDVGDDDVGGSGGGGGSGGCLGTGGSGGGPGGGSFGIFVVGTSTNDRPLIQDNWIQPGRGGNGGFGGAGGVGGEGGRGGRGGGAGDTIADTTQREFARCAQGGGNGGDGGGGGHGGGGGGGAGGPSYALYVSMPGALPTFWKTDNFFNLAGQGGAGGPGGTSTDQSRSGANGANGVSAHTNF